MTNCINTTKDVSTISVDESGKIRTFLHEYVRDVSPEGDTEVPY